MPGQMPLLEQGTLKIPALGKSKSVFSDLQQAELSQCLNIWE